jgi:hypothetical protein
MRDSSVCDRVGVIPAVIAVSAPTSSMSVSSEQLIFQSVDATGSEHGDHRLGCVFGQACRSHSFEQSKRPQITTLL